MSGFDVEHLEHPLEADHRAHDVEPGGGQRGERGVEPGEQQRHGDDGAGLESAREHEVAAEAVDQRLGQARHQGEGPEEHLHRGGRLHPDVADPLGPGAELGGLLVGPAEQLDERGAGRREPLGHLRRHRRVVAGRLPLEHADLGADPPGRDHEHREQQEGQRR